MVLDAPTFDGPFDDSFDVPAYVPLREVFQDLSGRKIVRLSIVLMLAVLAWVGLWCLVAGGVRLAERLVA